MFPKNSANGTPRHGWVDGLGGVFYRAWFFAFVYANDIGPKNNLYVGQYTIFLPLNRRFEWQFDVPFIVSNKGGTSNTYHGNIGDLTIHNRFMLSESDTFGQLFEFDVRVPTGNSADNGNGVASHRSELLDLVDLRPQLGLARLDGRHGAHQPRQNLGLLVVQ